MAAVHPSHFHPELTDERLCKIAVPLLDVRYTTMQEMNSPYDDNYTHECTIFGRSKNALIQMALSGKYKWMELISSGNDVTFSIGHIPCRFFQDDHNHPKKKGFFRCKKNDNLSLSLFEENKSEPVMWRFVIEMASTGEDEDRVYFAGYNVFQEKVSEWMYQQSTPTMHIVDRHVPPVVPILPAEVTLREDEASDERDSQKAANAR
jgi:hypothetical protein